MQNMAPTLFLLSRIEEELVVDAVNVKLSLISGSDG